MHQTSRGDVLGQDYNGGGKKKDKILESLKTSKELNRTSHCPYFPRNCTKENHVTIVSFYPFHSFFVRDVTAICMSFIFN
jgi:hypothetical protein